MTKNFNDSLDDLGNIIDFAVNNKCSIKFIEIANDKDKIATLDEIKNILINLGIKKLILGRKNINER